VLVKPQTDAQSCLRGPSRQFRPHNALDCAALNHDSEWTLSS
jgi:hypothetical protein